MFPPPCNVQRSDDLRHRMNPCLRLVVIILDRYLPVSDPRAHTSESHVPVLSRNKRVSQDKPPRFTRDMPERSPSAGWDIRHLFSPPPRATEGREDPHTETHVPAHGAPANPTPITLMDMSDQEGAGSASDPEATLTHPSARDTREGSHDRSTMCRRDQARPLLSLARPTFRCSKTLHIV